MKKILAGVAITTSVLGAALFTQTPKVAAHGYVQSPPARAYQGKLDFDSQGWTAALSLYGMSLQIRKVWKPTRVILKLVLLMVASLLLMVLWETLYLIIKPALVGRKQPSILVRTCLLGAIPHHTRQRNGTTI